MSGPSTDSPRSGASSDIVAHAWAATTSDVTSALETGPGGLTSAEAAARLMRDGPNALHTVHVRPPGSGTTKALAKECHSARPPVPAT